MSVDERNTILEDLETEREGASDSSLDSVEGKRMCGERLVEPDSRPSDTLPEDNTKLRVLFHDRH